MDKWYFKCRDGSYYLGATKQELKKITDLEDAILHLKKMDYPIILKQWRIYKEKYKINFFDRYISWCRLAAIKSFGYNDSELFVSWT